jgi:hypothetical protein
VELVFRRSDNNIVGGSSDNLKALLKLKFLAIGPGQVNLNLSGTMRFEGLQQTVSSTGENLMEVVIDNSMLARRDYVVVGDKTISVVPRKCKEGLNGFGLENSCGVDANTDGNAFRGYLRGKYRCYDGSEGVVGDSNRCVLGDELKQLAVEACRGKTDCQLTMPIPKLECGFCGRECVRLKPNQACIMLAPESNVACVEQDGECRIVPETSVSIMPTVSPVGGCSRDLDCRRWERCDGGICRSRSIISVTPSVTPTLAPKDVRVGLELEEPGPKMAGVPFGVWVKYETGDPNNKVSGMNFKIGLNGGVRLLGVETKGTAFQRFENKDPLEVALGVLQPSSVLLPKGYAVKLTVALPNRGPRVDGVPYELAGVALTVDEVVGRAGGGEAAAFKVVDKYPYLMVNELRPTPTPGPGVKLTLEHDQMVQVDDGAEIRPGLNLTTGQVRVGEVFKVDLKFTTSEGKVSGVATGIAFDKSKFRAEKVITAKQGMPFSTVGRAEINNEAGRVDLDLLTSGPSDKLTSKGLIASIMFKALVATDLKNSSGSTIALYPREIIGVSSDNKSIKFRLDGAGSLTMVVLPTPTATPTPADICRFCPTGKRLIGDADCNSKIELFDFNVWRGAMYDAVPLSQLAMGDMDCNKKVELLDFETWRSAMYDKLVKLPI